MATFPEQLEQVEISTQELSLRTKSTTNPLRFQYKRKSKKFVGNKLLLGAGASLASGWVLTLLSVLLLPSTMCKHKKDVLMIIAYSLTFVSLCLLFLSFFLFVAYLKKIAQFLRSVDSKSVRTFQNVTEQEIIESPPRCQSQQLLLDDGITGVMSETREIGLTDQTKHLDTPKNLWVLKPSSKIKSDSQIYDPKVEEFMNTGVNPSRFSRIFPKTSSWRDISQIDKSQQSKKKLDKTFADYHESDHKKAKGYHTDITQKNSITRTNSLHKDLHSLEQQQKQERDKMKLPPKRSSMPASINRKNNSVVNPQIKRFSSPEKHSSKNLSMLSFEASHSPQLTIVEEQVFTDIRPLQDKNNLENSTITDHEDLTDTLNDIF